MTTVTAMHKAAVADELARGWGRGYPRTPMIDAAFTLTDTELVALRTFKAAWLAAKVATDVDAAQLAAIRTCAEALLGELAPEVERGAALTGRSDGSTYNPAHIITLRGALSVITALHELTHARGYGEVGAVWWSVNAFRLVWPKAFAKLRNVPGTHVMRKVVR